MNNINYDHIMIRFGELSTKGKNKKDFINTLGVNVKHALKDFKNLEYQVRMDHIYIKLNDTDYEPIIERLKDVSGIYSFSLVMKVDRDIENLKNMVLDLLKKENKNTFKIKAKRADKLYPIISDEINRVIAGYILQNTNYKVDIHNPDVLVSITIRADAAYIFTSDILGAGGYPLGVGGKALHMISGGIDSPVAAYLMMKRGVKIECVHFASPPYTSEAARNKVLKLAEMMSEYQGSMRVHVINFTDIQLNIYKTAGDPYAVTIMRRMMYRLAERVAKASHCLAIGTGESVGQVASQTLESIAVINETITMPVLRPLVCFDKVEIIDLARHIGTYETSILPFEDCCTIFDPKNPVTHPTSEKSVHYETMFDYETLLNEAIEKQEVISVYPRKEEEEFL